MARKICTVCETPIDNGKAVIRTISFEQVAFHPECYLTRGQAPSLALTA